MQTGLARSTVSDIVGELQRYGYLERDGYAYRLGRRPQVLALLAGVGPASPIAHDRLSQLSRVARRPVALAALVGRDVLYLDSAGRGAPERLQALADAHRPRPALRTAAGRLLVAMTDEDHRSDIVGQVRRTDPEAVARFLQERPAIARTRLARSDGLADPGIQAIAVPVTDHAKVIAAVVVIGPRARSSRGGVSIALEQAVARVVSTAPQLLERDSPTVRGRRCTQPGQHGRDPDHE